MWWKSIFLCGCVPFLITGSVLCFDWGWIFLGLGCLGSAVGMARWGWGSLVLCLLFILSQSSFDSQVGYTQTLDDQQIIARGTYKDQSFIITRTLLDSVLASQRRVGTFVSIQTTLDELIETEILKIEAEDQHLQAHPQVRLAQKQVLVQTIINREIKTKIKPDRIADHYVNQATQSNLGLFRHPALRRASHVIVKPKRDTKDPITQVDQAILLPLIQRIQDDLNTHPPHDVLAFQKRALLYQEWMPKEYEARFEVLKRFSSKGPYVPSFTEACFKITQPHTLTPIIETQYGYHIAWVTEVIKPKDTPDQDIEKEVRRRLLPEIQGFEFKRLFGRLQKQYPIKWITPLHP
jgi:hypothetical protein